MNQDYVNARFLEWWSYHPRLFKDDIFPGWMKYECKIKDPKEKTVQMIREGYLRVGTREEQLAQLTVADLKGIADKQGLKVGSKKQDIIKAIITSGNDDWRKYIDAAVAITDKGLELLKSGNQPQTDDPSFLEEYIKRDASGNIVDVDLKRYATDYNKNSNEFNLLSTGRIREIIVEDFTKHDFSIYGVDDARELKKEIKAVLLWEEIAGKGERIVGSYIAKKYNIKTDIACMIVRTEHNIITSKYELKAMHEAGFNEYEVSVIGDCERCRSLIGKHFKISEAIIGVNCPPIHIGCRCKVTTPQETSEDIQGNIKRILNGRTIEDIEKELDRQIAEKKAAEKAKS